jgi:hypothetical protein
VRYEAAQGDEDRPLGTNLQELASNHLKLLWLNARVVSVKEKTMAGSYQMYLKEFSNLNIIR